MTKQEIIKKANSMQGANREFSQEFGPIVEGIIGMVEDNIEEIEKKQDSPTTAGTSGQLLGLDAEGKPEWKTPSAGTTPDVEMSDSSTNAVQNKVIKKWGEDTFAKPDGYYGQMSVGSAENLVGQSVVEAEYTYRQSGGTTGTDTGIANITTVKGKTLKWQQMLQNGNFSDGTTGWTAARGDISASGRVLTFTGNNQNNDHGIIALSINTVVGHKYIIWFSGKTNVTNGITVKLCNNLSSGTSLWKSIGLTTSWNKYTSIWNNTDTTSLYLSIRWSETSAMGGSFMVSNINVIDLTEMFGAGNEPSTAAEFEALYPLNYYNYTATPVLINNAASGIETTGFNQWDEEWEKGSFDNSTGQKIPSTTSTRSKNYIKVIPNTEYNIKINLGSQSNTPVIIFYDANYNYLVKTLSRLFTTPNNAHYIMFRYNNTEYGSATYKNDICINLSDPAKNGTYEPYEKHTFYFDKVLQSSGSLATVTGKLDGEGESVVVFPDGLRSVGNVFDEINGNVAIKRISSRAYTSGDESDATVITDGTITYYALSTPETYILDQTVTGNYQVNALGTERRLPEDTASAVNAPVNYSVIYPIDAVGTITKLPINYISEKSLTNFTTELASKLGTFLNATIGITATYNQTTQEYDYSITITQN